MSFDEMPIRASTPFAPERIPGRRLSIRIDWMNTSFAKSLFAMLYDRREFRKRHEFEWLD
jgi:hypothetical protein